MRIEIVPCLSDNYAYLVICEKSGEAAVIDPSEAQPVLDALEAHSVTLTSIWNTHHHWDHTGGNNALVTACPGIAVLGYADDEKRIPGLTRGLVGGDEVTVGSEVSATIIFNPGHTLGAISFHLENEAMVFTGDTLFGAGCGRVFEGTASQMHASLMRLSQLPESTRVYCGHEYTENNLRFAAQVEPDNQHITARSQRVAVRRKNGLPTVPFSIEEERKTNPFLRAAENSVARAARQRDPSASSAISVFAALRAWKDQF